MARKAQPSYITEGNIFPTRLRNIMKSRGITQKALANAIKMRPQTVSLYTTGQSAPDVNTLRKMAEFFNVSADYLLGLVEDDDPDKDIKVIAKYTGLSSRSIRWLHHRPQEEITQVLNALIEHTDFIMALHNIVELKHVAPAAWREGPIHPPLMQKRNNYVLINNDTYAGLLEYKITESLKSAFKDIGYSDVDFEAGMGEEIRE